MNKYIQDYDSFVETLDEGKIWDTIKKMGSSVKKFVMGRAVLKKAINMYSNAARKELSLYKRYRDAVAKAEIEKENLEDKHRGEDSEGSKRSIAMKELFAKLDSEIDGIKAKITAEIDQLYDKVEAYISDKSKELNTLQTNMLNSKKNLIDATVKIEKLKIDSDSYKKMNDDDMSKKADENIRAELDKYKEKEQEFKEKEQEYKEDETKIKKEVEQKKWSSKIEELKGEIENLKKSYLDDNGKFVSSKMNDSDKKQLQQLNKDKLLAQYKYLNSIPKKTDKQNSQMKDILAKIKETQQKKKETQQKKKETLQKKKEIQQKKKDKNEKK